MFKSVSSAAACLTAGIAAAFTISAPPSLASITTHDMGTSRVSIHRIQHPVRTFWVHGYGYPKRHWYHLTLWKRSTVHNCAAHSYGLSMKRYFRSDPCRTDTRYLYTTRLHGRAVVLEIESVVAGILKNDENGTRSAGRFIRLLKAPNTGSINDLIREGYRVPGVVHHIPAHEVFHVLGEDSGVVVFDSWYSRGDTSPRDGQLLRMDNQLFLTRATEAISR